MEETTLRELARTLREINAELLKPAGRGRRRRWFQGREPYFDVFFELDDEGVSWFQLTLRGRAVTWARAEGIVRTGLTNEREVADEQHPASKLLTTDAAPDPETLSRARVLCDELRADPEFDFALSVLPSSA